MFSDMIIIKEKLIYAIQSGVGFKLSGELVSVIK